MNILVVSHYYAAHGGGIENVVRQLLLAFREVAPRYRFSWAATACDEAAELPGVVNLPMAGTNIIEQKLGVPLPLWSWRALKQLAAAVQSHDAIWLHDTLYFGNIIAFWLAWRSGKPVIITQHIGTVPYQQSWLRALVAFGNRWLAAPMLRRAYRAVFIAAQVQVYFTPLVGEWVALPPCLIPNGVQHSVFKTVGGERRAALRAKFGFGDKPVLLFVGRFVAKKGLPILELLARAMPEVDWVFAGPGPLDPEIWGLPQVRVLRERSGAAIAELYQAADLLVLPSIGEGLPLVIQEAAACALPVLCTAETAAADPALPALLNQASVLPLDPVATAQRWREHITALLSDRTALAAQGEALARFARYRWSWQDAALRYADLFAEVPIPPEPLEDDTASD